MLITWFVCFFGEAYFVLHSFSLDGKLLRSLIIFLDDLPPFFNLHLIKPIINSLFLQQIVKNISEISWNILFWEHLQSSIQIIKQRFRINMTLFNRGTMELSFDLFLLNGCSAEKRSRCELLIIVRDSIRILINRSDFPYLDSSTHVLFSFTMGTILIFFNIFFSNRSGKRPAILNLFLNLVH